MTIEMLRNARYSLAALVIAAMLLAGIGSMAQDEPAAADPPPGQLLVASAAIQDPRFYHAVILLVGHDRDGAFGLMINRPIGERPLASLLAENGAENRGDAPVKASIRIFFGGPVERQLGFVIHGGDYRQPDTRSAGSMAVTADKAILRDIGQGRGPKQYLFVLGYAGWGAGQLEAEIARRDWFIAPADPDIVFHTERGAVWEKALARRTREM